MAHKRAMAPPARMLRAVSSLGLKPNCGSAAAEIRNRVVNWELVMAHKRLQL